MPREAPTLSGAALDAVRHRGSHVQIIASAGSGKTEVVSQRVVDLLAERVPPAGIVAFTFTDRAAAELKERITDRVEARLDGTPSTGSTACSLARSTRTASDCCSSMYLDTRRTTS